MGACPVAHGFPNPANNGKFVGKHARGDDGEGGRRGENGLKGASALAAAAHLPPSDEEREARMAHLIRSKASFGKQVARQPRRVLAGA